MDSPNTKDVRVKLLNEAIDKAQGPGECSYVKGCVIAQLALSLGTSQTILAKWEKWEQSFFPFSPTVETLIVKNMEGSEVFVDFDRSTLTELQMIWDEDDEDISDDSRRSMMKAIVRQRAKEGRV